MDELNRLRLLCTQQNGIIGQQQNRINNQDAKILHMEKVLDHLCNAGYVKKMMTATNKVIYSLNGNLAMTTTPKTMTEIHSTHTTFSNNNDIDSNHIVRHDSTSPTTPSNLNSNNSSMVSTSDTITNTGDYIPICNYHSCDRLVCMKEKPYYSHCHIHRLMAKTSAENRSKRKRSQYNSIRVMDKDDDTNDNIISIV